MVEVVWPDAVLETLTEIVAYIDPFDPAAAVRTADELRKAGESLAYFPNRGRPGPRGTRELATVPPYVIRYRATDDLVTIIHIRRGARRPLD